MKNKNKGFTLIELLVVVAIIGILAVVGVVAYNGYTSSAKTNATKTMHSQAVKYISAEIQKCSLGESKFMGTDQDCPATAAKAVTGAKNTMTDKNTFPMPFLMSSEKAAKIIFSKINSNIFEIYFPKMLLIPMKILSFLPYRIYFYLIKKFVKLPE